MRRASRCCSTWCSTTRAESDGTGPTLSFRGLDNASYYRHPPESPAAFENHSGCGNTLDIRQPRVLQLVMDSLRYWVSEMHVDGFRFDLAPVLGRGDHGFEPGGAFFTAVAQDPVLSQVKMIAEPWDIGPGGYQVGDFPRGWLEWNDHFRDVMRGFWLQDDDAARSRGDFALRLCASSDLYQRAQPRAQPCRSITWCRTTASRCATWSATTSATTRPTARTTATATATT